MKYLILGSGPAGIAAAKAIRGKDKKGQIVVVTEEPGPPYLRPLLTDLIMGRIDAAGIADDLQHFLACHRHHPVPAHCVLFSSCRAPREVVRETKTSSRVGRIGSIRATAMPRSVR